MSKVAISQSNYIPWLGYFELISSVSHFVFLDNVQYTKRDWRNRNQIKTPQGKLWLSADIVGVDESTLINEVQFANTDWKVKHLEAIRRNYRRSEYFASIFPEIEEIYNEYDGMSLSKFNQSVIQRVASKLGIETRFHTAGDFVTDSDPTMRLLEICLNLGASTYVSGPAAKGYMNLNLFDAHGVDIEWFVYSNRGYRQLWGEFDKAVTVLDPILNNGWEVLQEVIGKK
jgi:hypothetical protein